MPDLDQGVAGVVGAAIGAAGGWLLQVLRAGSDNRGAAFAEMRLVVDTLREDVRLLRQQVAEEREAREAAEEEVHRLRDEVRALRVELGRGPALPLTVRP